MACTFASGAYARNSLYCRHQSDCFSHNGVSYIMIDPTTQAQLKRIVTDCINTDQGILDTLRAEIQPLKSATRQT